MLVKDQLYIDGQWLAPVQGEQMNVINPANGQVCLTVAKASEQDALLAIAAARKAFVAWSSTAGEVRAQVMENIAQLMRQRYDELVEAHVLTMGCPRAIAGAFHVDAAIEAMDYYASLACGVGQLVKVDEQVQVLHEAVGVCAFINPWNYPLHQLVGKLAPALAAGCTVVAKPAEQTPLADLLMAEICAQAGLPAGVFNVIPGLGPELGPLISSHREVDFVSFTGSTASGIKVAQAAAPSVKRVCQELGGKSPYIITENADLAAAVRYGVEDVMGNTGQTCNALTRMFVPDSCYDEAVAIAVAVASEQVLGDPSDEATTMGPLASKVQLEKVRHYLQLGEQEGAVLACGGLEFPEGCDPEGFFVLPSIFSEVSNDMAIAQQEIFGPVLCMIRYQDIEMAIEWANDTPYGLSSGVWAGDSDEAIAIGRRIRAGQCYIQGGYFTIAAPFGGYKQSGNGREWGRQALEEYLETKAIIAGG